MEEHQQALAREACSGGHPLSARAGSRRHARRSRAVSGPSPPTPTRAALIADIARGGRAGSVVEGFAITPVPGHGDTDQGVLGAPAIGSRSQLT